ncbi:MAG: hypothetical protein AAGI15_05510 [Pseudomonadota bacterium]
MAEDSLPRSARVLLHEVWPLLGGDRTRWFAALGEAGWFAPRWPQALGGQGLSAAQFWRWQRALIDAGAPLPPALLTEGIGPLLQAEAPSPLRKEQLADIAAGRARWCFAGTPSARATPMAVRRGGPDDRLHGTLEPVVDLVRAQWILALVANEAGSAVAVTLPADRERLVTSTLPGPVRDAGHPRPQPLFGTLRADGAVLVPQERLQATTVPAIAAHLRPFTPALDPQHASVAALRREFADLEALRAIHSPQAAADDRALAELQLDLRALDALEHRLAALGPGAAERPALAMMHGVKALALALALTDAQVEALGYAGLPLPDLLATHNEGPLGDPLTARKIPALLAYRGLAADHDPWEETRDALGNVLHGPAGTP